MEYGIWNYYWTSNELNHDDTEDNTAVICLLGGFKLDDDLGS